MPLRFGNNGGSFRGNGSFGRGSFGRNNFGINNGNLTIKNGNLGIKNNNFGINNRNFRNNFDPFKGFNNRNNGFNIRGGQFRLQNPGNYTRGLNQRSNGFFNTMNHYMAPQQQLSYQDPWQQQIQENPWESLYAQHSFIEDPRIFHTGLSTKDRNIDGKVTLLEDIGRAYQEGWGIPRGDQFRIFDVVVNDFGNIALRFKKPELKEMFLDPNIGVTAKELDFIHDEAGAMERLLYGDDHEVKKDSGDDFDYSSLDDDDDSDYISLSAHSSRSKEREREAKSLTHLTIKKNKTETDTDPEKLKELIQNTEKKLDDLLKENLVSKIEKSHKTNDPSIIQQKIFEAENHSLHREIKESLEKIERLDTEDKSESLVESLTKYEKSLSIAIDNAKDKQVSIIEAEFQSDLSPDILKQNLKAYKKYSNSIDSLNIEADKVKILSIGHIVSKSKSITEAEMTILLDPTTRPKEREKLETKLKAAFNEIGLSPTSETDKLFLKLIGDLRAHDHAKNLLSINDKLDKLKEFTKEISPKLGEWKQLLIEAQKDTDVAHIHSKLESIDFNWKYKVVETLIKELDESKGALETKQQEDLKAIKEGLNKDIKAIKDLALKLKEKQHRISALELSQGINSGDLNTIIDSYNKYTEATKQAHEPFKFAGSSISIKDSEQEQKIREEDLYSLNDLKRSFKSKELSASDIDSIFSKATKHKSRKELANKLIEVLKNKIEEASLELDSINSSSEKAKYLSISKENLENTVHLLKQIIKSSETAEKTKNADQEIKEEHKKLKKQIKAEIDKIPEYFYKPIAEAETNFEQLEKDFAKYQLAKNKIREITEKLQELSNNVSDFSIKEDIEQTSTTALQITEKMAIDREHLFDTRIPKKVTKELEKRIKEGRLGENKRELFKEIYLKRKATIRGLYEVFKTIPGINIHKYHSLRSLAMRELDGSHVFELEHTSFDNDIAGKLKEILEPLLKAHGIKEDSIIDDVIKSIDKINAKTPIEYISKFNEIIDNADKDRIDGLNEKLENYKSQITDSIYKLARGGDRESQFQALESFSKEKKQELTELLKKANLKEKEAINNTLELINKYTNLAKAIGTSSPGSGVMNFINSATNQQEKKNRMQSYQAKKALILELTDKLIESKKVKKAKLISLLETSFNRINGSPQTYLRENGDKTPIENLAKKTLEKVEINSTITRLTTRYNTLTSLAYKYMLNPPNSKPGDGTTKIEKELVKQQKELETLKDKLLPFQSTERAKLQKEIDRRVKALKEFKTLRDIAHGEFPSGSEARMNNIIALSKILEKYASQAKVNSNNVGKYLTLALLRLIRQPKTYITNGKSTALESKSIEKLIPNIFKALNLDATEGTKEFKKILETNKGSKEKVQDFEALLKGLQNSEESIETIPQIELTDTRKINRYKISEERQELVSYSNTIRKSENQSEIIANLKELQQMKVNFVKHIPKVKKRILFLTQKILSDSSVNRHAKKDLRELIPSIINSENFNSEDTDDKLRKVGHLHLGDSQYSKELRATLWSLTSLDRLPVTIQDLSNQNIVDKALVDKILAGTASFSEVQAIYNKVKEYKGENKDLDLDETLLALSKYTQIKKAEEKKQKELNSPTRELKAKVSDFISHKSGYYKKGSQVLNSLQGYLSQLDTILSQHPNEDINDVLLTKEEFANSNILNSNEFEELFTADPLKQERIAKAALQGIKIIFSRNHSDENFKSRLENTKKVFEVLLEKLNEGEINKINQIKPYEKILKSLVTVIKKHNLESVKGISNSVRSAKNSFSDLDSPLDSIKDHVQFVIQRIIQEKKKSYSLKKVQLLAKDIMSLLEKNTSQGLQRLEQEIK